MRLYPREQRFRVYKEQGTHAVLVASFFDLADCGIFLHRLLECEGGDFLVIDATTGKDPYDGVE